MLETRTESGRTLMAVLLKEGAYETIFYSKIRRFASQADVIRLTLTAYYPKPLSTPTGLIPSEGQRHTVQQRQLRLPSRKQDGRNVAARSEEIEPRKRPPHHCRSGNSAIQFCLWLN